MCYLKALGAYDLNLKSINRWDGVSLDPALCELNRKIHECKLSKINSQAKQRIPSNIKLEIRKDIKELISAGWISPVFPSIEVNIVFIPTNQGLGHKSFLEITGYFPGKCKNNRIFART